MDTYDDIQVKLTIDKRFAIPTVAVCVDEDTPEARGLLELVGMAARAMQDTAPNGTGGASDMDGTDGMAPADKLTGYKDKQVVFVPLDKITAISASKKKVYMHMRGGRTAAWQNTVDSNLSDPDTGSPNTTKPGAAMHGSANRDNAIEVHHRLYELEEMLEGTSFIRISNSEIVNFDTVTSLDMGLTGTIELSTVDGRKYYVSRRYMREIKDYLESRDTLQQKGAHNVR
jgi:DNA-binding LytR/AlgR family response regulator